MKKTNSESLIVRHVGDIYHNANSGKGHSWRILNGALYEALKTCITAHLKFEPSDFDRLYFGYQGGYWFGTDRDGEGHGERFYSFAVECSNMSACQSFEAWREFKPFLFLGRRLCVGSELNWPKHPAEEIAGFLHPKTELNLMEWLQRNGHRWFVTGMTSEKVRVASYYRKGARGKYGHAEGSPTKLSSFTHDQLDAMSRDLRKALSAFKTKKAPKGWVTRETSIKAGNCPSGTDDFIARRIIPHLQKTGANVGSLEGAAISGRELMKIEDSTFTRRVLRAR